VSTAVTSEKEVNRNVSEALAKEKNDAEAAAVEKKSKKRSKERAARMRAERKPTKRG